MRNDIEILSSTSHVRSSCVHSLDVVLVPNEQFISINVTVLKLCASRLPQVQT